jgi:hypothetical protein
VVERHHGDYGIECAKAPDMLDRFPDKTRMTGSGRVHAQRIKAEFPQTVNQAAIPASNVEDS